jgi:glc operon protein GlcG
MALTLDKALNLIGAAVKAGESKGVPIAAVVVDSGGRVLASARSEHAGYINLQAAERKAVASANFKAPTHAVLEMVKGDSVLLQAVLRESDILLLPGGFPLVIDGLSVGGLGVAGGHYSQDQAIADQALAAQ